jgi:hypothetical protein
MLDRRSKSTYIHVKFMSHFQVGWDCGVRM